MRSRVHFCLLFFVLALSIIGCVNQEELPVLTATAEIAPTETPLPTETPPLATPTAKVIEGEETQTPVSTATSLPPTPTPFDPANWRELPVIPAVSARAREIYQQGQALGNNPASFSKIGDCESRTTWYLVDFDRGEEFYDLGPYTELQEVIGYFSGSYERLSVAAGQGYRASSILSTIWADQKEECEYGETPLSCEFRIQNPSFAIITMGTNDVTKIELFEPNLREILDQVIEAGVVPILATKADNLEGDHSVNQIIASVALEYDIPLWNYWAAVNELPDGGLQEDGAHLTWAPNEFGDPQVMQRGWPVRNLTALQVLDAVWRGVTAGE